MKPIINKIFLYSAFIITAFNVSCKKEIFTAANNNPNSPSTVIPGNILPGIEADLAYIQGGDLARFACMFVQQDVGYSRQAEAYYNYVLTSPDFDTPWGNMFTSVLGNNDDLIHKSDSAHLNRYAGIGRIIKAYSLQLLVDEWGSIPYTQALKGEALTHPAYDKDQVLYDTIANLLDEGITQLNNTSPGGLLPAADDLIYNGDADAWIKFGHAIKARLYIHQSKGNASMATKALDEANLSFADAATSAQLIFGNQTSFSNPVYQFNQQRGDIDYGSGELINLLTSLNDPRVGLTSDPNYSDVNQVGVGAYYGNINGHVEFIMYDEIEFIKAEAILRSAGDYVTADTYYSNGIRSAMEKLGVAKADIDTYVATNGTLPITSINDAIAAVATQEYIALYQNPEAWTTWRRTEVPKLDAVAGTNGVPRRFLYPQSEYSLNGDNIPQATLYSPKIFWDK